MIICAFPPNAFEIVRQAKARNYTPRGIFVTPMLVNSHLVESLIIIRLNGKRSKTMNLSAVMNNGFQLQTILPILSMETR